MPFVAKNPHDYIGRVIGSGQCVDYVRAAARVPHTNSWIEGEPVWEAAGRIAEGTAIATFDATGRYANNTDGTSHAAIFNAAADDGIWVFDQWVGHPVSERLIMARGDDGLPCDDADAYAVIEVV